METINKKITLKVRQMRRNCDSRFVVKCRSNENMQNIVRMILKKCGQGFSRSERRAWDFSGSD